MDPNEIAQLIEQGLDDSSAEVRTDGQGHYEAIVVSAAFEGRRSVARHQMVYATLGSRVGNEIHSARVAHFHARRMASDGSLIQAKLWISWKSLAAGR